MFKNNIQAQKKKAQQQKLSIVKIKNIKLNKPILSKINNPAF